MFQCLQHIFLNATDRDAHFLCNLRITQARTPVQQKCLARFERHTIERSGDLGQTLCGNQLLFRVVASRPLDVIGCLIKLQLAAQVFALQLLAA